MTIDEAVQIAVQVLDRQVRLARDVVKRSELSPMIESYEEAIRVLQEAHPPKTLGISVVDHITVEDHFGQ